MVNALNYSLAALPSQVIKAVLKDADDKTELALLYANQTPDDILLFDELQALAADPRLRIHYTGAHPHFRPPQQSFPGLFVRRTSCKVHDSSPLVYVTCIVRLAVVKVAALCVQQCGRCSISASLDSLC